MNEAYDGLKVAVQRLIDEGHNYPSWEELKTDGLEYVAFEFVEEKRWENVYLYVFRKGADLAGVLIAEGKTENQEDEGPEGWDVVEVEPRQTITYEVKQ